MSHSLWHADTDGREIITAKRWQQNARHHWRHSSFLIIIFHFHISNHDIFLSLSFSVNNCQMEIDLSLNKLQKHYWPILHKQPLPSTIKQALSIEKLSKKIVVARSLTLDIKILTEWIIDSYIFFWVSNIIGNRDVFWIHLCSVIYLFIYFLLIMLLQAHFTKQISISFGGVDISLKYSPMLLMSILQRCVVNLRTLFTYKPVTFRQVTFLKGSLKAHQFPCYYCYCCYYYY